MNSASQILHAYRGAPAVPTCSDAAGLCWVCGAHALRTMPRAKWMGACFTGQNRARCPASDLVCEACVWSMAGKPPDTLRMTSHLFEEGVEYLTPNKGDKPAILAFLRRPHTGTWIGVVADGGKIHIVPWAPVNPPGSRGRVAFENMIVQLPGADGWDLLDEMKSLLTAGATKGEIETSAYSPRAWQLCGAALRAFEEAHAGKRGGGWFALALWLAQRDEIAVAARMSAEKEARTDGKTQRSGARKAPNENGRGGARSARVVPRNERVQRPETLGHDPKPDAVGGAADVEPRRVDDSAVPKPATARTVQLGLFG